jgi:hypothetical protein
MIVTAIIAVLLGIGRMAVLNLPSDLNIGPDGPVLVFLGVTAILMTVPLIVGALLPRWAIAASAILLVIIGVATAWEFPLLVRVQSGAPPEVAWLFFVINYVAAGWILIFALAARICGYSVARSSVSKPAESIES